MGDKPNYLLRIQKKCVINCSDLEEGWCFLSEPVGLRMEGGGGGASLRCCLPSLTGARLLQSN